MSDPQDEASQQRQEINMFAAMALGGSGSSGDDSYAVPTPVSNKKTGAEAAATATAAPTRSAPAVVRRRGRRPAEALDTVAEVAEAPTTTEAPAPAIPPVPAPPAPAPGSMEAFAAAAASQMSDHNSGTFKLSSPTSGSVSASSHHHNIAEKSNLDAALAALERDDDKSSSAAGAGAGDAAGNEVPLNMPLLDNHNKAAAAAGANGQAGGAAEAAVQKAANTPMFAEQVIMSRPLFFGALLPPRVIQQARLMVVTAQQKEQEKQQQQKRKQSGPNSAVTTAGQPPVRLSQMPPSVRNIVGAIRTYGHGIDVWQTEEEKGLKKPPGVTNNQNNVNKDDKSSKTTGPASATDTAGADTAAAAADLRGSPHVSTFQPVWSDVLRVERVEERAKRQRRRQRPAAVERGSTAPARLAGIFPGMLHVDEVESEYIDDSDDKQEQVDVGGGADKKDGAKDKDNQGPLSLQTQAGQSTAGDNAKGTAVGSGSDSGGMTKSKTSDSANNLFSMWLRADDDPDAPSKTDSSASLAVGGGGSMRSVEKLVSSSSKKDEGKAKETPKPAKDKPLTEQEMFSQWACGSDGTVGSTLQSDNGFNPSTFQKMPSLGPDDSDDDSVIDDELKKQVGMNDHLSKAVASLAGPGDGRPQADITAEESQLLLSRAPQDASRGRPLTNYELTNGCVPLFGVDDSPLPVEGDLGIHETKEEQQRSNEHKRSQDIIEKFVAPNVFGPIACPNPALNQDDCHSWNSRATPAHRFTGGTPQLPDIDAQQLPKRQASSGIASDNASTATKASKAGSKSQKDASSSKKKFVSRSRYGWWNVADAVEVAAVEKPPVVEADKKAGKKEPAVEPPLQLPPTHHSSSGLQVVSLLEPTPEQLREDNLPLSRMHAASSMTQTLPYLSDRPPSHRYLQVDTRAVGFPAIGGEVEPLFCSLAIFNVETVSSSVSENSAAPVPDIQRCGRVTEALTFDVISDQDIAEKCSGVLWPYATTTSEEERLQSTQCGVFPLPSNLNVANLYAVLIVRKVLADDPELDAYLKGGKHSSDLAKLRANARKSSNRRGNFLMPFAFGVAPLLQVFGMDSPVVASSRAVQIPLFRFTPALGERQILDHIMVMLYPRADHRANGIGGPAAVTNGGTAMLVMRNFGYLGLHAVVDNKSSLARDRLVDFTGELQLRRRVDDDEPRPTTDTRTLVSSTGDCAMVLPDWHPRFLSEPTSRGGRNLSSNTSTIKNAPGPGSNSSLYAQELAPLPLQLTPSLRHSTPAPTGLPRGRLQADDVEPYFHTSFCNELICHPRLLHSCPRGDIVIRVGLRELEWKQDFNAYFAHLPRGGPSVHNPRRGPFLVQNAFTSCSPRSVDTHFIDEFKIKLPLDLTPDNNRTHALFFSVFNVRVAPKGKWQNRAKKLFGSTPVEPTPSSGDSDDLDASGKSRVELVACGFLPLTSRGCLLDNGMHDVRVEYTARSPTHEMCQQGLLDASTLILVEKGDTRESLPGSSLENRYDSSAEDNDSASEVSSSGGKSKLGQDLMSLSVRIVAHSSLHSQNETLSKFLGQEQDLPNFSHAPNKTFASTLLMGREFLGSNAVIRANRNVRPMEDKMLESAIDITKPSLCALPRTSLHLWRVMPILWRSLICGSDGEPDLVWANPSTPIPLRVHSFATILHLLGAASMYMSKSGATQVDGVSKWNVVTLGRVLALIFDEQKLFGDQATEAFDPETWKTPAEKEAEAKHGKAAKKRRHVRQSYDLFNDMPPREDPGTFDSLALSLGSPSSSTQGETKSAGSSLSGTAGTKGQFDFDAPDGPSQRSRDVKVDSKNDFQSALRAAASGDDFDRPKESDGAGAAKAMIQAFSGVGRGSNRRWMTAPSRGLSTIRETDDGESFGNNKIKEDVESPLNEPTETDSFDNELVLNTTKRNVKQMRVPKLQSATLNPETMAALKSEPKELLSIDSASTLPRSDEEIENAGTAFLDVIGKSLGLSPSSASDLLGEDKRVGSSHHRKTPSRSTSIDWTLLGDDRWTLLGDYRNTSTPRRQKSVESRKNVSEDLDEKMSTLQKEESSSRKLPNFIDRLVAMGKSSDHTARWFPYAYEVIILQWAAILIEQRTTGDKTGPDPSESIPGHASRTGVPAVDQSLAHAASRAIGVAVGSAPLLFEVIKQSLGFRIATLSAKTATKSDDEAHPPLVTLDESLLLSLEQVISMVADACIDSRNFDSWDLRQMSIDVNDSIVRFLRDLFSFLEPSSVHRLILAYLSRFVTKDGKQWQDRDSNIGLRCSWEITKLRLNAVTALIRFPDFVRINGPQMLNWGSWWRSDPGSMPDKFFDDALDLYLKLQLPAFVGGEGSSQRSKVDIPSMRPHWLAELVVDICLLGTEHAEQYIQHRSASLLHEMFWAGSQDGILKGTSGAVASMHITFLEKLLYHVGYLSNFAPKSQLRKDVLPCAVFVLQSTPAPFLRSIWRRLCSRLSGKGLMEEKYGGTKDAPPVVTSGDESLNQQGPQNGPSESKDMPDILDMFSLLNLSLRTLEYEGSEENLEADSPGDSRETIELWRREYLLCHPRESPSHSRAKRFRRENSEEASGAENTGYSGSISRKWQAHDGSLVIINAGHQIVLEMYSILSSSADGKALLNPAIRRNTNAHENVSENLEAPIIDFKLKRADIVVFVRAATSLYIHALALRESDIVITRTFKVTAEVIKIFGIKIFLEAVGETLQHWMRVISLHCGARRALVRIEATDLLELVLRSTWECYGSFFRIRVPLLAVQTEVMERIVATAAARYYRDQRRLGAAFETFSTVNAEASLVPLWRTLDRIQKQPASQNIAFRGALIRMAEKLKKLYRAYIAARVLSFIQGAQARPKPDDNDSRDHASEALIRAGRISVLRVVNASEGHSKQFLGFHGTTIDSSSRVAHYEAVEDALIDAADVFSPTELPEHRVAWLRMLADFHASRKKCAEEATCHFHIHLTLQQAARLHGSLWSNTPFLPWTDNMPDPVYLDGESPNNDPEYALNSEFDDADAQYGRQVESANSFRRIFYRVANSVGDNNEEWDTGLSKNLFCGITYAFEYHTVSPWITLREMEEHVVEEAEAAGDLFLQAGIIESSRYAYGLATNYYAEKFNYAKLALAYGNLARTIVSQVPPIDVSLPQEVSATLGRFYRVWFHGGAPDELSGVEFVYRTEGAVRLDQFGEELREVIKSIIPGRTPIHLVLDGRVPERTEDGGMIHGFSRIGPAPLEPVKIKVTPLRPLFGKDTKIRGLPEWFFRYVDEVFSNHHHRTTNDLAARGLRRPGSNLAGSGDVDARHRTHNRNHSPSLFSSAGSSVTGGGGPRRSNLSTVGDDRGINFTAPGEGELAGIDKFCFVQPRDRALGSKDWWKTSGDYAEKSLKVTQLQVGQAFPACVARQAVLHRLVYLHSPVEAGVDAVCQWCAVLFRTAVATVGMAVLGTNQDPGIGTDASKVVADCIHSSHVKEIGLSLLKKNTVFMEGDSQAEMATDYGRLGDEEVKKLQLKLARLIVVYIELLHLLIARNRDILLDVIQERKKNEHSAGGKNTGSQSYTRATSLGMTAQSGAQSVAQSIPDSVGRDSKSVGGRESNRRSNRHPSYDFSTTQSQQEGGGGSSTMKSRDSRGFRPPSAEIQIRHHRTLTDDRNANGKIHSRASSEEHSAQQSHQSQQSTSNLSAAGVRTDSAIAVQSELQRAFISLTRILYPRIQSVMQGETPRWLKQCTQDNYFSLGTYKQTRIPISEELCFTGTDTTRNPTTAPGGVRFNEGYTVDSPQGSVAGSVHSIISRGSERYGYGQF